MVKDNEKSWLQDHEIEIYSAHNEGKSLDGERFIRASMKKIQIGLKSQKMYILINQMI